MLAASDNRAAQSKGVEPFGSRGEKGRDAHGLRIGSTISQFPVTARKSRLPSAQKGRADEGVACGEDTDD